MLREESCPWWEFSMRLLYLYPEEWTGRRAREVHTLSTCLALAREGVDVTLCTAGGKEALVHHVAELNGSRFPERLTTVVLSRRWGPIRSASIFAQNFGRWVKRQPRFDWAYIIHLKAGPILNAIRLRYVYEAHEIFAETILAQKNKQEELARNESKVLALAALRIATSRPLAEGLTRFYSLKNDFQIVPNAGDSPHSFSLARAGGPFVYFGSISDWKGLDLVLSAAHRTGVPLHLVGGAEKEWKNLQARQGMENVTWHPRVPLTRLTEVLAGARAGLISTRSDSPSGHYSCPMKLFDYARCGLQVISTDLLSYQSLDLGPWCQRIPALTVEAWAQTLNEHQFDDVLARQALTWSGAHTWQKRASQILTVLS